jgi:hypothetical protein
MKHALLAMSLSLAACGAQMTCPDDLDPGPDAASPVDPDPDPDPQPDPQVNPDAGAGDPPPDETCTPQVSQLLVNPAFDGTPLGAGWTQRAIAAEFPLISSDGPTEHSPGSLVWLGGIDSVTGTVTDVLTQDITIPADTTHLTLIGVYQVHTAEVSSQTVFDTAKVLITETDGTAIASILELSNVAPATQWRAFGHAIAKPLSGRTVRLTLTSTNDDIDATSFFLDSLSLVATHGCAQQAN